MTNTRRVTSLQASLSTLRSGILNCIDHLREMRDPRADVWASLLSEVADGFSDMVLALEDLDDGEAER